LIHEFDIERGKVLITRQSQFDVNTTLDRLEAALNEKGIKPLARVDHAAAARAVDLELRPTQVLLFGNPRLGTPLMQSDQTAGLDLPMRVIAWEDEEGTSWLGYHSPEAMFETLDSQDAAEVIAKMTAVLDALTGYAIKK
jgi:uncharacterized protein (DUF302 family)